MREYTLKEYTLMPEGCRWSTVKAYSARMAYSLECCWYGPKTKVAVRDNETGETKIFTRELDKHGNLIRMQEV